MVKERQGASTTRTKQQEDWKGAAKKRAEVTSQVSGAEVSPRMWLKQQSRGMGLLQLVELESSPGLDDAHILLASMCLISSVFENNATVTT